MDVLESCGQRSEQTYGRCDVSCDFVILTLQASSNPIFANYLHRWSGKMLYNELDCALVCKVMDVVESCIAELWGEVRTGSGSGGVVVQVDVITR